MNIHPLMHPVKKRIIKVIKDREGAFFGEILMQLQKSEGMTLHHLLDLKSRGIIYNDNDGGKFKLTDNHKRQSGR